MGTPQPAPCPPQKGSGVWGACPKTSPPLPPTCMVLRGKALWAWLAHKLCVVVTQWAHTWVEVSGGGVEIIGSSWRNCGQLLMGQPTEQAQKYKLCHSNCYSFFILAGPCITLSNSKRTVWGKQSDCVAKPSKQSRMAWRQPSTACLQPPVPTHPSWWLNFSPLLVSGQNRMLKS